MPELVRQALAAWGLQHCPTTLIAERENQVFRVETPDRPLVLRLHRLGYRSQAELTSELDWMAELTRSGVPVPQPIPTRAGARCVEVKGQLVDMLTFLDAQPLMANGQWNAAADPTDCARHIGGTLAHLHDLSDNWQKPEGFTRPHWDAAGLIGSSPLWDRFWENPDLTAEQVKLFVEFKDRAARDLATLGADPDYGLIHADAVPENVLVAKDAVYLIDFDDGGFGYRLFDLATTTNRFDRHDPSGATSQTFLSGYLSTRPLDITALPLFRALRAMTYVGWVISRLNEPGSPARSTRFIAEAEARALAYLDSIQGKPA
ncbi:homoserine kinase [Zhengella mangrovi]|uniref:Homoserine kinase n=1 Tax=Zhengella mangrovi TaxID=1982044 RepID=A0A2G1QIS0_9HYPH|nr:phosphotransferase [Zhengella mangrovi]PHP65415.1 homoserine kinase [Zhengella mangrovi]